MRAPSLPPHRERLLRRLRSIEAPVIQLWGWTGSGKTALLEALTAGEGAVGLALGDFASERALKGALEAAHRAGIRWLVVAAWPGERLAEAARWLRPGQRLVFACARRHPLAPLTAAVVPPPELLLDAAEVASLWRAVAGAELDPAAAERIRDATDGWYRPLRLAAEAAGGVLPFPIDAGTIAGLATVRRFFRHEMLAALPEEEAELLVQEGGEARERLLAAYGLRLEEEGERLPRLLEAFLEAFLEDQRGRGRAWRRPGAGAGTAPAGGVAYSLALLGDPTTIRRDDEGERELRWRLRKAFKVLAYLASSPGLQAGREELIEAVWPDEDEQKIERDFHPTLSHLRRTLREGVEEEPPPPLLRRGDVYRLNPEIAWEIDLLELARLGQEGRALAAAEPERAAEVWRKAWAVYRGPFLPGHEDAWVAARREASQRLYIDLLRDLGDLYLRLGQRDQAMDAFRALLMEDPLQERIHVEVMRLYADQGRRDLVRRQYDRLCSLLQEDLSVEPKAQTTREYHRLMA